MGFNSGFKGLKGDKQVIVLKPAGRVEDVSGSIAKTNLESINKRNSELALQQQQHKDVNTQYVKYMQPSHGPRTFWPYPQK